MEKLKMTKDLLTGIDLMNTLNGGAIEPVVRLTQFAAYRQIEIKVPGVGEEQLHVKINNNNLVIFYEIIIETQGRQVPMPQVVYNKQIPFFVDAQNITAHFVSRILRVQLPFNELANGFQRDVPIAN
jgi:HSP20 family molecular chaperone IbpA